MKGFWIKEIILTGPEKEPASITLERGANIITGPSDTGKSYLFSVINYTLGRSSIPDTDIPEGQGYDLCNMIIVAFETDEEFKLSRQIGENQIVIESKNGTKEEYSTTSKLSNENNISQFLLELCGLRGALLLKNRTKGDKQLLSFKNINQFTSIAEDRVITKSSPFYFTQNNSNHILEQSMISLILEEMDFSEVKSIEDPAKKEIKISGQLEFIDKQIVNYSKQISVLSERFAENNTFSYSEKTELALEINAKIEKVKLLENRISDIYAETQSLIENKIYHEELIKRFKILERQYLSDLERLEFIRESESLSSQLPGNLCPICSNPFNEDELTHDHEIIDFKESVIAEISNTNVKLKDLEQSILDSERTLQETKANQLNNDEKIKSLEDDMATIQPELENLQSSLDSILSLEKEKNQLIFYEDEIQNLYSKKDELEKAKSEKEVTDIHNVCDYEILKRLSSYIEERLIKWEYNENPKVVFDSDFKKFDIVISNKGRGSYGKGRRALSYSACLLGFLDFCIAENKKFSNLIIIDSPLTTFKDKETEELDFESIDDQFFNDLSSISNDAQVIIFENKSPNKQEGLNIIEFTRNKERGRYGFYPYPSDKLHLL
ncbi:hypothetical protein [Cyclobacterium marinum]|uniref:hypothetical protein n=1 Tax=Cyclobacterium marinum TaxID=104 RepID=UPI0011EE6F41|nr:hypothetical protein [Cyclobacterium marinum]MBI0401126.1 hypothetical protein [Cyclobacterium marinum]